MITNHIRTRMEGARHRQHQQALSGAQV